METAIINLPAVIETPRVVESTIGNYEPSMLDKDVHNWISDVRSSESKFLGVVVSALKQFQNKNNMPLTAISCLVLGKEFRGMKLAGQKGEALKQFKEPLSRILSKCLIESTLTFKDGKAKWKVNPNGGVSVEWLAKLEQLAKDGVSYKGKKFAEVFPKPVKAADKAKEALAAMVETLRQKEAAELSEKERAVVEAAREQEQEEMVKYAKTVLKSLESKGISAEVFAQVLTRKDL